MYFEYIPFVFYNVIPKLISGFTQFVMHIVRYI